MSGLTKSYYHRLGGSWQVQVLRSCYWEQARQNSPAASCERRDASLLPTHAADAKEAAVIRDMNVPKLQLERVLPGVAEPRGRKSVTELLRGKCAIHGPAWWRRE